MSVMRFCYQHDSSKSVKIKAVVRRDGEPVIKAVSSRLYRGRFADFENTFEVVDEPDHIVTGLRRPRGLTEWFQ
jgi:hypothetical protein